MAPYKSFLGKRIRKAKKLFLNKYINKDPHFQAQVLLGWQATTTTTTTTNIKSIKVGAVPWLVSLPQMPSLPKGGCNRTHRTLPFSDWPEFSPVLMHMTVQNVVIKINPSLSYIYFSFYVWECDEYHVTWYQKLILPVLTLLTLKKSRVFLTPSHSRGVGGGGVDPIPPRISAAECRKFM